MNSLSPQASQKRRPLSRLLEHLLRNLEKRDPHQFFAWPVNDNFAPGYSNIIRRPMDFSTIKQKIDDNEYKSLNCFIVSNWCYWNLDWLYLYKSNKTKQITASCSALHPELRSPMLRDSVSHSLGKQFTYYSCIES